MFRNNCFIQDMTPLLEQYTIPYHTSKGFCVSVRDMAKLRRFLNYRIKGYGTEEAKQAFAEVYGVNDFNDDFTESDVIPGEQRYIVKAYVDEYGLDKLEAMAKSPPFLLVSTPHRVKGGEAENVAVFLDCTRLVSENALLCLDEELRVLYVSCTRAKNGLYLVSSAGKYGLDSVIETVKEVVG